MSGNRVAPLQNPRCRSACSRATLVFRARRARDTREKADTMTTRSMRDARNAARHALAIDTHHCGDTAHPEVAEAWEAFEFCADRAALDEHQRDALVNEMEAAA